MKQIPLAERPRERCLSEGAHCLSLRECLAVILGAGAPGTDCLELASSILNRLGCPEGSPGEEATFFSGIETGSASVLENIPGLGPAQQARILATIEIGRRYSCYRMPRLRPATKLTGLAASAVERVPDPLRQAPQEWLGFVPFLRSGALGGFVLVEKGARTHVNTDPVELFAKILAFRPRGFFLFHNHPSGDTTASSEDRDLTAQVHSLSRHFGISLLGHGILSWRSETWISAGPEESTLLKSRKLV